MSTLEERVESSARRGSAVEIVDNPLETGNFSDFGKEVKVETTNDARPINAEELMLILATLLSRPDEEQAKELEQLKQPYLFSSSDLLKILEITTSLRVKLAIIVLIAPRLIDPRESLDLVLQMFRFSEDKFKVEEAYKHRIQILNAISCKSEYVRNFDLFGGNRGGRGYKANLRPVSTRGENSYLKSVFSNSRANDEVEDSSN